VRMSDNAASAPNRYEQGSFWACACSPRGAKITTGQKTMGHVLLLPLVRGLSRCLTKPLTRWSGN
jgi:hypothetical protein